MPINFAVKLAATVALQAAQIGLQASRRTKGPRLDELTVSVSEYGTPLPRFLGARKFSAAIFHAEDLKEVKQTHKIKGAGKQTTYHYLATFAATIADNEIETVLKIWFDDKLVYDATGTGPQSYAGIVGVDLASVMRIYYGTEDQEPDPRYVEWCESKYGPDSAPAYRGLSYLFFEELPVDNFGNRIPQIVVLAATASTDVFPHEQRETTIGPTNVGFTINGGWMLSYGPGATPLEWWDLPSRTRVAGANGGGGYSNLISNVALMSDGTAVWYGPAVSGGLDVDTYRFTCSIGGTTVATTVSTAIYTSPGPCRAFGMASYCGLATPGYFANAALIPDAQCGRDWFFGPDGDVWGLFEPDGASDQFTLLNMDSGGTAYAYTSPGGVRGAVGSPKGCYSTNTGEFFIAIDGSFVRIDAETMTIVASGTAPWGEADVLPGGRSEATSFWNVTDEYSLIDGSLLRTVTFSSWVSEATAAWIYDPINNAHLTRAGGTTHLTWRYIDRDGNSGTTLGAIVSRMCDDAGLEDRDTSLLTQHVAGYSWTRGDVKSQMEPVLDIHDVDPRPHDFTIQFLPRGDAPTGAVLTSEFVKTSEGARYKITIKQDTDLPKLLRVNFADTGFDQQTNNVLSPLPADSVDSQRDESIDLTTYAATADEAQQLSDRYIRREWNSREGITNALTARYLQLEPGDVKTLSLDGVVQNAKLTKQTFASGRIDCTFVRENQAVATLNEATTGPVMDNREPSRIVVAAPVRGFVIDAPYREDGDSDIRPTLYAGAGAYGGMTYPGAVIYEATGSGDARAYDTFFDSLPDGATWAVCATTLADVPCPWLWDRGNTLTVALQGGSLTSVTEEDIDADPSLNLVLVGSVDAWEYLNFTTATLNGDGSYTLSGFKRGRRGTEWACPLHAAGEALVFANVLDPKTVGLDEVGGDVGFKAQSIGRAIASAPPIDFTFDGNSLRPYAPARLKWTTDGTDLFGEIIRRTRVGGSWVGGTTIPLSENSEAYEVVVDGGVRTISVTGTNLFTYTAAQLATDGFSVTNIPDVEVYQMSDAVGRGFALAA